ncbi:MAG: hypothetical protein WEB05_04090 [Solirubrobacterales bacterium]
MSSPSATRLILGLALLMSVPLASQAQAAPEAQVHVRAVTYFGQILIDRTIVTGTTTVPTSADATCLGGTPTNATKRIEGSTALGALQAAARSTLPRTSLLISNAFDFGLGLCGVGSSAASGEQWWELTHNHRPSMVGGEETKLKTGDEVLWFLSASYNLPSPDELELIVPESAIRNRLMTVRVLAYNDAGVRRPVRGAVLSLDGTAATNAAGYTRIRLSQTSRFAARAEGFIASNRVVVEVKR